MRARNLPTIDAGYWAAIVAASICGTITGDLAAGPLGLGHVRGLLPLGAIFLAIIWAEKLLSWTTVAFYWLAIIVLRTMATNIADFATHDLKRDDLGGQIPDRHVDATGGATSDSVQCRLADDRLELVGRYARGGRARHGAG